MQSIDEWYMVKSMRSTYMRALEHSTDVILLQDRSRNRIDYREYVVVYNAGTHTCCKEGIIIKYGFV